jgi:CHAT domain-containing protein
VTDLFGRQADDIGLSRAEALRQAVLALTDRGEAKDADGKTLYTYAHPLFRVAYIIVGAVG